MMTTTSPFIVFEGIDGAGTTTQSSKLVDRLQSSGRNALLTCEPSLGPVGMMIRQMLSMRIVLPGKTPTPITRETLALLFAADRLDHMASVIEPSITHGITVVSDRYYHSSLAYQGDVERDGEGKEVLAAEVDYDWVRALNARALVPDLTFFLRVDVETAMRRIDTRSSRDMYETHDKLERLVKRYDEVIALLHRDGQRILILDGTRSLEDLEEEIWSLVSTWFGTKEHV